MYSGEPHQGNVQEYVFVLSGTIRISVEDRQFEIKRGEFLQFQAGVPHHFRCVGPEMASAIMQISYL
jgi:quercetin dioxygenase-like cupin family protein